MATWEDGPEYAPRQRPAEFSVPVGDPLEVVSTGPPPAATAPTERPVFDHPTAPVVDLARLTPAVTDQRDPARPFDVVSSTVTSMDSAWGALHRSTPAGPPAPVPALPPAAAWPAAPSPVPLPAPPPPSPPPPTHASWPVPAAPFPPVADPAAGPTGFPAPGTPAWFGSGPPPVPPPPPPVVAADARAVLAATTPGLIICLLLGGLLYLFAPAMLVIAYLLSSRVRVAQRQVRRAAGVALGVLVTVAVLAYLWNGAADSYWWEVLGGWARVICWVLLGTVLLQVRQALKGRAGGSRPGYPAPWP